jgi:hypothetical protein
VSSPPGFLRHDVRFRTEMIGGQKKGSGRSLRGDGRSINGWRVTQRGGDWFGGIMFPLLFLDSREIMILDLSDGLVFRGDCRKRYSTARL